MTADQPLWRENVGEVFHARHYRRLLRGLTRARDGLMFAGDLAVTPQLSGLGVTLGIGAAIVLGTDNPPNQGAYYVYNDAPLDIDNLPAHGTDPRIDLLVAQVVDSEETGGEDDPPDVFTIIAGVAGDPDPPDLPDSTLLLRTITVPAAASTLSSGNIVGSVPIFDRRVLVNMTSASTAAIDTSWGHVAGFTAFEDAFGFAPSPGVWEVPAGLGGWYEIKAGIRATIPPDGYDGTVGLSLLRNGSARHLLTQPAVRTASTAIMLGGSKELKLAAGDSIAVDVIAPDTPGANPKPVLAPFSGTHYFSARLLER